MTTIMIKCHSRSKASSKLYMHLTYLGQQLSHSQVKRIDPLCADDKGGDLPVTIMYKTFVNGSDCRDYYTRLLHQLRVNQDLNEVSKLSKLIRDDLVRTMSTLLSCKSSQSVLEIMPPHAKNRQKLPLPLPDSLQLRAVLTFCSMSTTWSWGCFARDTLIRLARFAPVVFSSLHLHLYLNI